jgi:hypothetical protein
MAANHAARSSISPLESSFAVRLFGQVEFDLPADMEGVRAHAAYA